MLSLEDLKEIAKMIDQIEILTNKLEGDYSNKNGEEFNKTKSTILELQYRINEKIK